MKTTNTTKVCEQCGAMLPADAPRGLCPRCMMQAALEATADTHRTEPAAVGSARPGPSTVAPEIGAKLRYFGDYELIEKIAEGGMGVVFKARQRSLNRTVAVKMILRGQLANEADVKRFRLEAEAAANLQHPNIVAIHEVGMHAGQDYFSMDYVPGKNLAEIVRDGRLDSRRAARWVETIAEAIQYAHQRGILHRDLKPQNVLLDEREQPRITDFGLARRIEQESSLTATGEVLGSPSYMAPEQASGRQGDVGPATDVYAMGAILYHLSTGQAPFIAETPVATMMKVLNEEPVSPRKLNPAIPLDLETVCLKCLEKKPEHRYATARALAEDLERFLNHEPVLARPASVWRKGWSWSRRHPWVMVLGMAIGLVLLLGVVFWLQTENEFLKFKDAHPEYVKAKGPMSERLGAVVRSFVVSIGIFVAAFMALFPISAYFAKHPALKRLKFTQFMRHPLTGHLFDKWGLGGICFIHGIIVIRRGVEAHIWEGGSWAFPLSLGLTFLYFGLYLLVEGLRFYRRGDLQGADFDQFADFYAGLAELRRGDLKGFWHKAVSGARTGAGTSDFGIVVAPRWRITPGRVFWAMLMGGLAVWGTKTLGDDYGSQVMSSFGMSLFLGVVFNGLYWAVKGGLASTTRAGMFFVFMVLGLLMPALMIYTSLRMIPGENIGQMGRLMLLQGLLGTFLGLAASFPLLDWRKERKL